MRMLYGFLFSESGINDITSDSDLSEDVVEILNSIYQDRDEEIEFGEFDLENPDCFVYAGIEITSDILTDADDHRFSIDLDQVKEVEPKLGKFLEMHGELEHIAYSVIPRIFCVE